MVHPATEDRPGTKDRGRTKDGPRTDQGLKDGPKHQALNTEYGTRPRESPRATQSSAGSSPGAILTSRGSNRASGSTRSLCAAITSSMFLYAIGTSSSPADSNVTPRD